MRIGIEMNNIIRDINRQMVKYYKKDIVKDFDDENINYNVTDIFPSLVFSNKNDRFNFLYEDYPFEVFGCAQTMSKNLANTINNWIYRMSNQSTRVDVSCFSLKEEALSIQSSYYFLSKSGIRVRETYYPKDGAEMWDICDVIITINERIVMTKPEGKKVVLIRKDDNQYLEKYADLVVDSLDELLNTPKWLVSLKEAPTESWFTKIKNKLWKK